MRRPAAIGDINITPLIDVMLDLEALGSRLHLFEVRTDRTLFVKATGGVSYGRVVEAMDVARGAGAERIGIVGE